MRRGTLLSMLTTNQKSAIAEAAVMKAALHADYDVYRPVFEGGRYDLVFRHGRAIAARPMQVGAAPRRRARRSFVLEPTNAGGLVRRPYVAGEFDALAAYAPDLERCYLIPYEAIDGRTQLHLRVGPTPNNQRRGIRLASPYEFGGTLRQTSLGPIAQLGERLDGIQKVAGSSPAGSTS
jgi:PD-(D/E)XK endonuclease